MRADRFLTWLFYSYGLHVDDARRLTMQERNRLVDRWIALGCPFAIGI
jgi:hypothetical protein